MGTELIDREAAAEALRCYGTAIEKDPTRAEAYSDAIVMFISAAAMGLTDIESRYRERYDAWLAAARPITARAPMLELAVAIADYMRKGDASGLRRAVRNALRRAPFTIDVLFFCGWAHIWLGEPEAALDCFRKGERGVRFNPYAIPMLGGQALASVQSGQDEAAIAYSRAGLEISTEYGTFHRTMASALAHLGRKDEAAAALAEALRLVPGDTIAAGWARSRYADMPATHRYFEGLRLAGMPDGEE